MDKILLVRVSSLGDLVHTFPAVTDLMRARQDIELHWLTEVAFAAIAQLHPAVHKVHTVAWRQWRKQCYQRRIWHYIGELKQSLQQEVFHRVIDSQGLIKSAIFARLAAAPIAGLDWRSAREGMASLAYQQRYHVDLKLNAITRNRVLFAAAFDYEFDPNRIDFGLKPLAINTQTPYHVGLSATSQDHKLWPIESWRQLLTKQYEEDGLPVYLMHGNAIEAQRAACIAADRPFIHVAERMPLQAAVKFVAAARSVVGVDTGLLHIANAYQRPVVGIFTATDPKKTGVIEGKLARNIGGIQQIPQPLDVLAQWREVLANED